MSGTPWSLQERSILVNNYSKHGPEYVRQRLAEKGFERTYRSITWKACRLGHQVGIPPGYMSLNEVGVMMLGRNQVYRFVRAKAQKEGVLYHSEGAQKVRYAVPEEWAYALADDYFARMEVENSGWPRTRDVEKMLGFPHRKIYDILSGKTSHPLAPLLRSIEKKQGKIRHWYWNPRGVQLVKEAMRGAPKPRKGKKARKTYSAQVH